MPKLVISVDGVVIKQAQLLKERTTLGRRPYNDIVLDHLAISGEHAVILMQNGEVLLQDCNHYPAKSAPAPEIAASSCRL